jgi:hypothetical protein
MPAIIFSSARANCPGGSIRPDRSILILPKKEEKTVYEND